MGILRRLGKHIYSKNKYLTQIQNLTVESLEPRILLSNWSGRITEDTVWYDIADQFHGSDH
ncbi:MAG: LEPR-XLL domain-containing protein [Planctomycetes bacterium]|nr:LEPR-XLL domain-containing protein [Planctomycetota bacterium]